MRTILILVFLSGCGAAAPHASEPAGTGGGDTAEAPTSLDEALAAQGLTRVTLAETARDGTYELGAAPVVEDGHVQLVESAGWSASPSVFAQRADGTVVLVAPRPNVVVDRHVDGGCLTFAGGRAWFETVTYVLPAGATYGGELEVTWDEHTEVVDHSDHQPDGSPCPPPALD